jgi:hypothetical protein
MRRFSLRREHASDKPVDEDTLRNADEAFDAIRMHEASRRNSMNSLQSQHDDASDTSSVVSSISKPRSHKSLFRKHGKRGSITLYSISDEYRRISQNWSAKCQSKGCPLSKGVLAEFSKRISQKGTSGKSKLNFTHCGVVDEQLIMLAEELALKPVVAKLDLSGNYISAVVRPRPTRPKKYVSISVCVHVCLNVCMYLCMHASLSYLITTPPAQLYHSVSFLPSTYCLRCPLSAVLRVSSTSASCRPASCSSAR